MVSPWDCLGANIVEQVCLTNLLYSLLCVHRNPRHKARLPRKLSELVAEVAKVDLSKYVLHYRLLLRIDFNPFRFGILVCSKTCLDLTVGCDDEEGEAVDVPTITLEV